MKKTIFLVLMIFLIATLHFKELNANQGLPVGKNYLSLSNLILSSDDQYLAQTISPIKVIPNQTFTLVLSFEFLGQHAGYIDYYYLQMIELPTNQIYYFSFSVDNIQERAYLEFTPKTEYIHIKDIPMTPSDYNAIMYQGTYQDFSGYEPYLHMSEKLDYYGAIPVNYDDLLTIDELKALITSSNPYNQSIELSVILDEYSLSNQLPGLYRVMFQAIYNQVAKRYHLDVHVYDITKPSLTNNEEFIIPLTEKINIEEIISYLEINDNVDLITHEELIIIEDTYSSATTVGFYHLLIEATDLSNNSTRLRVNIELIDRMAPIISGPPQVYVYTSDAPLTNAYIQSLFYIVDDVDGTQVTIDWLSNSYMQNQLPGIYPMIIRAKDSQLNTSTKQIEVHVIENKGPIFESDDLIFEVSVHDTMTHQQIIDWFIDQALNLGLSATHVRILYNEYELSNKSEGSYYIYLSYLLDGVETTSRVVINVTQDQSNSMLIYYAIGTAFIIASSALFIIKKKKI